jgi:hypothetical protein
MNFLMDESLLHCNANPKCTFDTSLYSFRHLFRFLFRFQSKVRLFEVKVTTCVIEDITSTQNPFTHGIIRIRCECTITLTIQYNLYTYLLQCNTCYGHRRSTVRRKTSQFVSIRTSSSTTRIISKFVNDTFRIRTVYDVLYLSRCSLVSSVIVLIGFNCSSFSKTNCMDNNCMNNCMNNNN